ncbi:MAG: hypothetical protein NTU67_08250 [Gemmatimonadetes bacterium]|nr:hypothetical protein [Gemmatimonadota bacterium]
MTTIRKRARRATWLAMALALGACDSTQKQLLNVTLPDVIPSTVSSPEQSEALRIGALTRLRNITAGGEGAWMLGGLLTDEWKSSDTFSQRNETDQRSVQESNGNVQGMLREIYRVRNSSQEALIALAAYPPLAAAQYKIGTMYLAQAIAEIELAETFCNGIPLSDAARGAIVYGSPLSNIDLYNLAKAHLDTAITNALPAADANAVTLKTTAQILQGRILLNLGQHAAAATAVSTVASSYSDQIMTFSLTSGDNQIWSLNSNAKRWTVGDSMDTAGLIGNALPFASSGDARLKITGSTLGTSAGGKGFDGATNFITNNLWARSDAAIIASGLDARLIEAEVKLKAADYAGMMTILNGLRTAPQKLTATNVTTAFTPTAMAAISTTPATASDAAKLFFREKAFWTYGRGQRLGDLRRMIRQYGFTQDQVFPTGTFFKGGTYGTDVNFPITTDEYNNPNYKGCTDRRA